MAIAEIFDFEVFYSVKAREYAKLLGEKRAALDEEIQPLINSINDREGIESLKDQMRIDVRLLLVEMNKKVLHKDDSGLAAEAKKFVVLTAEIAAKIFALDDWADMMERLKELADIHAMQGEEGNRRKVEYMRDRLKGVLQNQLELNTDAFMRPGPLGLASIFPGIVDEVGARAKIREVMQEALKTAESMNFVAQTILATGKEYGYLSSAIQLKDIQDVLGEEYGPSTIVRSSANPRPATDQERVITQTVQARPK